MKKVIKILMVVLVMLFVIPVFAESGVSVLKIKGASENSEVILNVTDKIDVEFNELEQNVVYNITLKNNTNKTIYVHDVAIENLSEEFINFSLVEKSLNTKIEVDKEEDINVLVETLDIDHAGRNVDEEITLKILYGNSLLNPNTSSNIFVLFIMSFIILFLYLILTKRFVQIKKLSIFIIGGILISITTVSANNNYAEVKGNVKYVSQNLLQESGVTLNGSTLDYSNTSKIWSFADKIKKIIISDDKSEITNYEEKFILTNDSSERVVGYLVDNSDESVPYDLYIQADGVIYAPTDSTGLFAFPNVESIEGLDYIEFDETTKMTAMFKDNKKLKELDVSAIDMSSVTDTSYMFYGCNKLKISEDDFILSDTVIKDNMFPVKIVNIISGDISTVGSVVAIGDEQFYVFGQEDGNVKLLSKYNLHVGYKFAAPSGGTALTNPTGIQDSTAIGTFSGNSADNPVIGGIPFSSSNYWHIPMNTSYPAYAYAKGSTAYSHVENYKSYLEGLGATIEEARLISKEELVSLGCSVGNLGCSSAPSWVYATSYWTGTADTNQTILCVTSSADLPSYTYAIPYFYGVRPVIEISADEF